MKRVLFIGLFIGLFGLCTVVVACMSDEGERCESDDDCAAAFTCNTAKNVCQGHNNMPLDAMFPEGLPVDAPSDAPQD